MSSFIKIDTTEVLQIAQTLSGLNDDLQNKLQEAKKAVNDLGNVWEGEAASVTIEAVNTFAAEYFQSYRELIDSYIEFLRKNVAEGYEDTETVNTSLADSFK